MLFFVYVCVVSGDESELLLAVSCEGPGGDSNQAGHHN